MEQQQQFSAFRPFPEAYALTLNHQELHDLTYASGETTFPESRDEIPAAQRRALLLTRINKLLMSLVIIEKALGVMPGPFPLGYHFRRVLSLGIAAARTRLQSGLYIAL